MIVALLLLAVALASSINGDPNCGSSSCKNAGNPKHFDKKQKGSPASSIEWDPNCGHSPYEDAGTSKSTDVNGTSARPHEFPWQVSVRYSGGGHFCGGSLVNSLHVITAANCLFDMSPSEVEVVVGEHLRYTNNEYKQTFMVAQIIMNPAFDLRTWAHDAAILRLSQPVNLTTEFVGTICAPKAGYDYVGINAVVSGWSTQTPGEGTLTSDLRYHVGPIISNKACNKCMYGAVSNDMLCQGTCGSNVGDACQGDSGGPLAYKDENGRWTLVGIVSWGFGCADIDPGVYFRVTSSLCWFQQTINGIVGDSC